MPPDYIATVPNAVAGEVVGGLMIESVVMKAGKVITVPSGVDYLPVVSAFPQAGFTNPAYGGRKKYGDFDIENKQIALEEIAVALAVPDAYIEDVSFPLWDNLKPMLTTAISVVLDNAVLFGIGAPATFPTGGLMAAAQPAVSGDTPADALNEALTAVETRGILPDGIVMGVGGMGAIRSAQEAIGLPAINADAARTAYGLPLYPSVVWDDTNGDAIVGDYDALIIAIRSDIRYSKSNEGVITDGAGAVVVNAWQDNQTLFKAWLRVGAEIVPVVGPTGYGGAAFAAANFPAPGAGAMTTASRGTTRGGDKSGS